MINLKNTICFLTILCCYVSQNIHARLFDIVAEPYDLITLDGKKIETDFKVIEIPGDAPTYGTIRKYIAQSFNIDPSWENFTIRFYDPEVGRFGKFFFLKPYLDGLNQKERLEFLGSLTSLFGIKGKPLLLIRKRKPEEFKNYKSSTMEEKNLGWDFDETLVGESDLMLVKQLKMVSEKYK